MLPQFEKQGCFNLQALGCNNENLLEYLESHNALFHKSCYSKYNQRMLDRLIEKKKSKKDEGADFVSPKRPRRSEVATTSDFGERFCLFCSTNDDAANLCAAGALHATKEKVDPKHVAGFTEKLKRMASVLENTQVLSKLSLGDVASNEVYYHRNCYKAFCFQYEQITLKKSDCEKYNQKAKEQLIKATRFNQIVNYVYDKKRYESVNSFEVASLEKLYIELLSHDNIEQTSHVSRFAENLLDSIPEVEKRVVNKKNVIFFSKDVDDFLFDEYMEPNDFIKTMNRIALPIRKAMKNIKNEFSGDFNSNCQRESVPTELLTLISMLIEGTNVSMTTSQSVLTCAQIIMYNFRSCSNKVGNTSSMEIQSTPFKYHNKKEKHLLSYTLD